MTASATHPKKRHTLLKLFVVLVLAALVGFGAWLGLSAKRVSELFGQAMTSYDELQVKIEAQDYDAALTAAREAASYTSQASTELAGKQWDIAANIPVIGADVNTVRSIGTISGKLADDAVLPVLDSWDQLANDGLIDNGKLDLGKVPEKLTQVVDLAKTLQEANSVVDTCSAQANALPESHFDAVNEWTGELRGTVASIDTTVDKFSGVVNLVVGMSDTISSLTNATVGALS